MIESLRAIRLRKLMNESKERFSNLDKTCDELDTKLERLFEKRDAEEGRLRNLKSRYGRERKGSCPAFSKKRYSYELPEPLCILNDNSSLSLSKEEFYADYCSVCKLRHKKNLEARVLGRKLKGSKD